MIPDHSTGTGEQGRGRHQKVWSAGYTTPLLSRHGADAIASRARSHHISRRGGRVVERTALEMRHTCKGIGGSNPPLSANLQPVNFKLAQFLTFLKFANTLYLHRNLV